MSSISQLANFLIRRASSKSLVLIQLSFISLFLALAKQTVAVLQLALQLVILANRVCAPLTVVSPFSPPLFRLCWRKTSDGGDHGLPVGLGKGRCTLPRMFI